MGKRVKLTTYVDKDLLEKFREYARKFEEVSGFRAPSIGRLLDKSFKEMISEEGWILSKKLKAKVAVK